MATPVSDSNSQAAMRQYLDNTYAQTWVRERPFLDRVTKVSGMGGKGTTVPFSVSYGGGVGGTFETALANAQESGAYRNNWTLTPGIAYGVEIVNNADVPFSAVADDSVINFQLECTKNSAEACAQNTSDLLLGSDGTGAFATIASYTNPSGTLYTLVFTDPFACLKFPPGSDGAGGTQIVTASSNTASLDSGSAITVGQNAINGSITVDAGSTGWTPTNGHVVGIAGQFVGGSTLTNAIGVFGFIPPITSRTAGVVGDTFCGVTRNASTNVVAVSGFAFDGRGGPILPTLSKAGGAMANFRNSKPDTYIVNPSVLSRLAIEVNQQVRDDMPSKSGDAEVLYSGFVINLASGRVEVLGDSSMPANESLLTKADTWVYGYPEKMYQPCALNGDIMVPSYDHDKTRFAIKSAGYFYTTNPAASANILLA